MSDLAQLHADLLYAAAAGGEQAGADAVAAGVNHTDSAPRALANVESVRASFAGPLAASVTASQPRGVSRGGPSLPDPSDTADIMADTAAATGAAAIGGRR